MSMTKQDYEALAALLKAQRGNYDTAEDALDNLARDMAQYMSSSERFDMMKFLAAAGVP